MDAKLQSALDALNPAELDYAEWCSVGMALHEAGEPYSVWDAWSRADDRFKSGECHDKWQSFGRGSGGKNITAGTVIKMARDRGWDWTPDSSGDVPYGWDDQITVKATRNVVDAAYVDSAVIEQPGDSWDGCDDLIDYVNAVFNPDDRVSFVTKSSDDGKPASRGSCMLAKDMLQRAKRRKGVAYALSSDISEQHGAWIRFNPVDGTGVGNRNITDLRHTLIESDTDDTERQLAIIRELRLPISAIVHSGNKSIHAIVRVDAGSDREEYRRRVERLYEACRENGLAVDAQNKNESRLSRLPGVPRNGKKQFLIAKAGDGNFCRSWDEWMAWYENESDAMPDLIRLEDVFDDPPPLADEVIYGLLRRGHKMLISGPSKAGKSFALIELCIAIATGTEWLGFRCAKGRAMYVNLELDGASCIRRFITVSRALGFPSSPEGITIFNLRGKALPLDELIRPIERRALKERPDVIIIDPLYKVLTGDENSASEMARFCNFFDMLASATGCSIIYCHHHSKGDQTGKASMDRASGSGVFARDPDALIDLLEVTAGIDEIRDAIRRDLADDGMDGYAAAETAAAASVWRVSGILREFQSFAPRNIVFTYPIHTQRWDAMVEVKSKPQKGTAKAPPPDRADDALLSSIIELAFAEGREPTLTEVAESMHVTKSHASRLADKVRRLGYLVEKAAPNRPYIIRRASVQLVENE